MVASCPRALVLTSAKGHECRTEQVPLPTAVSESAFIIDWIRKRIERGMKPCEIAVLSRSSRSIETVELALKFQKIPYRKYGGLTLGDSSEVKDFIAFLRLAFNANDRVALVRCLTLFPGVGESSAEKYASTEDDSAGELFAVERSLPRGAGSLNEWLAKLRTTQGLGARGDYLLHVIYPLIERNYPQNHAERMATLQALVDSMKSTNLSMAEFLDAFSLEKSTEKEHPESELTVATIHASKGLEYDCVVLCGAGSAQMPHPKSTRPGKLRGRAAADVRRRHPRAAPAPDHLAGRRRARLPAARESVPAAEISVGRVRLLDRFPGGSSLMDFEGAITGRSISSMPPGRGDYPGRPLFDTMRWLGSDPSSRPDPFHREFRVRFQHRHYFARRLFGTT